MQSSNGDTYFITNCTNSFLNFKTIPTLPISGIQPDDTPLYATDEGILPV